METRRKRDRQYIELSLLVYENLISTYRDSKVNDIELINNIIKSFSALIRDYRILLEIEDRHIQLNEEYKNLENKYKKLESKYEHLKFVLDLAENQVERVGEINI